MEKHINEVVSGDCLAQDVVSERGLLLLRKGVEITRSLKSLLIKHSVSRVWVLWERVV